MAKRAVVGTTVHGVGALRRKFVGISAKAEVQLFKVVKETTAQAKGTAQRNAPKDTGELEGSIKYRTRRGKKGPTGTVSTNTRHAPFQEFGTVNNAAQPFMAPAAEEARGDLPKRVRSNLRLP